MSKPFNVLQFGFGSLGKSIAKAILERENLHLVGLIEIDPTYAGKTVEESLSSNLSSQTKVYRDLESFSSSVEDIVNVAVIATSSALDVVAPTIID